MEKNIVTIYKVSLQNSIVNVHGFSAKNYKVILTNNNKLTEFINSWRDIQEIDEDLMPDILNVLSNNVSEENASETVGIKMNQQETKLFGLSGNSSSLNPDFVLPTEDFKKLIEGWRNFLSTPPLSGTKI